MVEELSLFVPVVAHRIYGTKYLKEELARKKPWLDRLALIELNVHNLSRNLQSTINIVAELDSNHGTKTTLQEIRAFFKSDSSLDYTTESPTVNLIWASAGIQFKLVATVDHMISSHYADFMPSGSDIFKINFAKRFNKPGVLNLYFVKELIAAKGIASIYLHGAEQDMSFALIDDGKMEELPIANWKARVITLAHEFGHFLGLSHKPDVVNVMLNGTHYQLSKDLEKSQWRIAQHRARYFRTPLYEFPIIPHLGIEIEERDLPEW